MNIKLLMLVCIAAILGLFFPSSAQAVFPLQPPLNLLENITFISAGQDHTCALMDAGGVKCWGDNGAGQLGSGSTSDSQVPVDVSGLTSGVIAISTGDSHTCALTAAGGVKCWGDNEYGQLGDSAISNSQVPVDVAGLSSGVTALSAGSLHNCVLTDAGGVKCWGRNGRGQLGSGSMSDSRVPVDVAGLSSGVIAVSAAGEHTCALTAAGGVKCWGYNIAGQLGNGSTIDSAVPVDVSGLSAGVIAISAGGLHSCALTDPGDVKCWGRNSAGQLGNGSTTSSLEPVGVSGLPSGVIAIVAGGRHTCALTDAGGVKCWGYNRYGQVGNDSTTDKAVPVDVSGLSSGVSAVSAGENHTCALTAAGGVKCWGRNSDNQLGNGSKRYYSEPVDISGLSSGVIAVDVGSSHTCVITDAGGVKCWWGYNSAGQPGDGSTLKNISGASSGIIALSSGGNHTCMITDAGGVKCFGDNSFGQLGNSSTPSSLEPVDVLGLPSDVIDISASGLHTCAVTSDDGIKCWGYNSSNREASGLDSGVSAISTNSYHNCALMNSGGVKCWGDNGDGQLGNGSTTNSWVPVDVSGLSSGIIAISAGQSHTCALTAAGGVKCWGNNGGGQLGNGSTTDSLEPVDVSGLDSGIIAISADYNHTCALTDAGVVKCWGGSSVAGGDSSLEPVDVSGLGSGVVAISAHDFRTCAVTATGGVKCWGSNRFGQIDGFRPDISTVPTDVVAPNNSTAILGNVDCDDDLDAIDALFTLQYAVGQRDDQGSCPLEDSTTQLHAAGGDLDGSGQTDAVDALFMLQCSVGVSNAYCGMNAAGL